MKTVRTYFCALIAGCLLSGCNKPADNANKPAPANQPSAPTPTTDKSEFPKATADALAKEYASDSTQAMTKYKTKAALISGTVAKKVGDGSDRTYIVLKAGDAAVQCELAVIDDYTKFRIKTLKEGDAVNVIGEPSSSGLEAQADGSKLLTMTFCKLLP